jgi:hypothetical protein
MKSVIDEIEDETFPCYYWINGQCYGQCHHPCTLEYEDLKNDESEYLKKYDEE